MTEKLFAVEEKDVCNYATDPRTKEIVDRLFAYQRRMLRLTEFLRGDAMRRYVVSRDAELFSCQLWSFGGMDLACSDDGNTSWHPTIEAAIDVALDNWEKRK